MNELSEWELGTLEEALRDKFPSLCRLPDRRELQGEREIDVYFGPYKGLDMNSIVLAARYVLHRDKEQTGYGAWLAALSEVESMPVYEIRSRAALYVMSENVN